MQFGRPVEQTGFYPAHDITRVIFDGENDFGLSPRRCLLTFRTSTTPILELL